LRPTRPVAFSFEAREAAAAAVAAAREEEAAKQRAAAAAAEREAAKTRPVRVAPGKGAVKPYQSDPAVVRAIEERRSRAAEAAREREEEAAAAARIKTAEARRKLAGYFARQGVDPRTGKRVDEAAAEAAVAEGDAQAAEGDGEGEHGTRGITITRPGSAPATAAAAAGKAKKAEADDPVASAMRASAAAWREQRRAMKARVAQRPLLVESDCDDTKRLERRRRALLSVKDSLDRQGLTNYDRWFDREELILLGLADAFSV